MADQTVKPRRVRLWLLLVAALAAGVLTAVIRRDWIATKLNMPWMGSNAVSSPPDTYEREITDVAPAISTLDLFTDDNPSDKKPVFDPDLFHLRSLRMPGDGPEWQVNLSEVVIRLDVLDFRPDYHPELARLYPSYADALKACKDVLPSINMLDGKSKQFDDGLYAALDLWMFTTQVGGIEQAHGLVRKLADRAPKDSKVRDWLVAALHIGGLLKANEAPSVAALKFVDNFNDSLIESKPIGFYTWSDDLNRAFRFLRFLQQGFRQREGLADDLAGLIVAHADLAAEYSRLLAFYGKLTNPYIALTLNQLTDAPGKSLKELEEIHKLPYRSMGTAVHFLPYSTSREVVLIEKLFPEQGFPAEAQLMVEFVKAIRSGKVDLKPGTNSGWYDYQCYALETFLLPERGKESAKLAVTKKYKQRMLEAFQALLTKRRETHVRGLVPADGAKDGFPFPRDPLAMQLRVEPNPTYFLRTARAYAFLQTFLKSAIPADVWKSLVGLKQGGKRDKALAEELEWIKRLFYGLHLISCEDIGMKPDLLKDELAKPDDCYKVATDWLKDIKTDPDLAADTRVVLPIALDPRRDAIRSWGTLGVRGVNLFAWYYGTPKIRLKPEAGKELGEWKEAAGTTAATYVILTDEFGEFERAGNEPLTREEFRAICDKHATKDEILKALAK